jgi:hypothetical protein
MASRGVILAEDDLNVGDKVCVYSLKHHPNEGAPILGQALEVKAIQLPYFIGKVLSDENEPVVTLDCRFLNLMRVSDEFVQAQREGMGVTGVVKPRKPKRMDEGEAAI